MQITRALLMQGQKSSPPPSGTMMALRRFRAFWTRFMTDTWNISQRTACNEVKPYPGIPELLDNIEREED